MSKSKSPPWDCPHEACSARGPKANRGDRVTCHQCSAPRPKPRSPLVAALEAEQYRLKESASRDPAAAPPTPKDDPMGVGATPTKEAPEQDRHKEERAKLSEEIQTLDALIQSLDKISDADTAPLLKKKRERRAQLQAQISDLKPLWVQIKAATSKLTKAKEKVGTLRAELDALTDMVSMKQGISRASWPRRRRASLRPRPPPTAWPARSALPSRQRGRGPGRTARPPRGQ